MGKLRIAVVHSLPAGGAARRLKGSINALSRLYPVDLTEFRFERRALCLLPTASAASDWSAVSDSLPRAIRPPFRYVDYRSSKQHWGRVWDEINRAGYDVIFANPAGYLGGAPPWMNNAHVPVFYYCDEVRRVDYEADIASTVNPATAGAYRFLAQWNRRNDRASIASATRVATNSLYTSSTILCAYGRQAAVVTPGIADVFSLGDITHPAHVLSVGTLIESKGHHLVIEAMGRAKVSWPLIIVAPRPNAEYARELLSLAASRGVRCQVLVGVSDAELAALYRSAFVTMYVSRNEPLGLVSLESQACGTPVIVCDEGGLPETMRDGESGFVVHRDVDSVASALSELGTGEVRAGFVKALRDGGCIPRNDDAAKAIHKLLVEACVV